jgi:uncharacterized OsmC-like protein
MASADIAAAVRRSEELLRRRPSAALQADSPALCRWIGGVSVAVGDSRGREVVSDLPPALGGGGEAFTPGWFLRAGLAACAASGIAMRAASEGIALTRLEVEARSRSDARGLFGMTTPEGPVDPGPRDVELSVRIAASNASPERLRALVAAAQAISPVRSAFERATAVALVVETDP